MTRESDYNLDFNRKELVCSHIARANEAGCLSDKDVYPLCVQIYEDGYELFWFCPECCAQYGLPRQGIYVFDAEEEFASYISSLEGYSTSSDPDENPFSDFLEEQKGYFLSQEDFAKLKTSRIPVEPVSGDAHLLHIPFGCKPIT